jgi:hypothetical protein
MSILNKGTMKQEFDTTSVKQTRKVGCKAPSVTRELVPMIRKYINWIQQHTEIRLIKSCNN